MAFVYIILAIGVIAINFKHIPTVFAMIFKGAFNPSSVTGGVIGAELTINGFIATYGNWVSLFTAVALVCFAFSTALGWGLYGSRCIEYIFGSKVLKPFAVVYAFIAIIGATADLRAIWGIAETFNGLMVIPNLIAVLLLSKTFLRLVKDYFSRFPIYDRNDM